ncbi:mRNA decay activator protein ZFP36L1 [Nilaparvata lugens]|uniref:mRNA decay activator protein ZFP36L1 n=1 Tax=Nilaparvata lugens TaxID=108931 RepID=UPI00193C8BED|nr:mRNA decay activator protein ZFP36L1 [Nilaparvata lugens]
MSPATHMPSSPSTTVNDFELLWQLQTQSGLVSPLSSSNSSLASGISSPTAGQLSASQLSAVELQLLNQISNLRWGQQTQQQSADNRELSRQVSAQPYDTAVAPHRRVERTQSEPSRAAALAVNTSRYKTELCRSFEESGFCKYGDKCQFAHGPEDLRKLTRHPKYKTELCRTYHSNGMCPYGSRCHFRHSEKLRTVMLALAAGELLPGDLFQLPASADPLPDLLPSSADPLPDLLPSSFDLRSSSLCSSPTSSLASGSPPPSAFSANTAFSFSSPVRPLSPFVDFPRSSSPLSESRLPVFNELSRNQIDCLRMLNDLTL